MNLEQWLNYQLKQHPVEINLGLERVASIVETLGLTEFDIPIISVAGTNGKGSTVALIEKILTISGKKTGVYSSPHFVRYTERMRLSGQEILEPELCGYFEKIEAARQGRTLTFFEFGTIAAVMAFVENKVDVIILEVGLGGRLDATNLWSADVAVLTNVALDHQDWLGEDVESIGYEKAGIFRTDKPAIIGQLAAPKSVLDHAKKIGARVKQIHQQFDFIKKIKTWDWQGEHQQFIDLPYSALLGEFQFLNAACAIQAVLSLSSFNLTKENLSQALKQVFLTGRLQKYVYRNRNFILDVAHNPAAAVKLAEYLSAMPADGKTIAIIGVMKDKAVKEMVESLTSVVDDWWGMNLNNDRAISLSALSSILSCFNKPLRIEKDNQNILGKLIESSCSADRIIVFGSFFTVAAFLETVEDIHV